MATHSDPNAVTATLTGGTADTVTIGDATHEGAGFVVLNKGVTTDDLSLNFAWDGTHATAATVHGTGTYTVPPGFSRAYGTGQAPIEISVISAGNQSYVIERL